MIDYGAIYPDEEDITLAFERSMATVREELSNLEQILKRTLEMKTFINEDECAAIFHCKKNEIPQALPRYRGSRSGYLYQLREVYEFIEERRIPKKK